MCHLNSRLRFILFPTIILQLYINIYSRYQENISVLLNAWMLSQPQRSVITY